MPLLLFYTDSDPVVAGKPLECCLDNNWLQEDNAGFVLDQRPIRKLIRPPPLKRGGRSRGFRSGVGWRRPAWARRHAALMGKFFY